MVFLSEDTQHITGGRYYAYFLACALISAGYDVLFYTNRKPIFKSDFKLYKQPEIRIVNNLRQVDVPASLYFGSPVIGNQKAIELGEKYHRPSYCLIFDPFPMMAKYKGQHNYPEWDGLLYQIRNSSTNIISLTQYCNRFIYDWLNKKRYQVNEVYPCINSKEKDAALTLPKKNWITFISRLDHHKNLDHVLEAVKETDCELHVITSIDGINFEKMVKAYRMEDQVKIHWFISDLEKFEIIKQSKLVINAATFEGFGMWMIEALSCGVPIVCYDYPTFREIADKTGNDKMVFFADWNNKKDFINKTKEALSGPNLPRSITHGFDFISMELRLRNILLRPPKIGVVMCALNEDEFILPSLKALLRSKYVSKVAVVEGCVNLNEHASNRDGLSKDQTQQRVCEAFLTAGDNQQKLIFDRYGWAGSKSELRNRGLELLGKDMDYILVVDGDEVWKQSDLRKIYDFIQDHPDASVLWFKTLHFWKKFNQLAVGSQWNAPLFRFFKYTDKTLHWERHESPVVNKESVAVTQLGKEYLCKKINFYHYGALKPSDKIKSKLEYYKERDPELTVKDTYSDWKPGDDTQWTHGGGTVKKFKGTHPKEIKDLINKDAVL